MAAAANAWVYAMPHLYSRIDFPAREAARKRGDLLLGIVPAAAIEKAVDKAGRPSEIARRTMACRSMWPGRVQDEQNGIRAITSKPRD